ncbi:MAG: hypothetical protein ABI992_02035 [Chthoniobacterales bacterium]
MKQSYVLLLSVTATALAFAGPLVADTLSVPSAAKPAYTLEAPAKWQTKVNAEDESVEATAPGEHAYLSAWMVSDGDKKNLAGDIEKTLADSMKKVDPGSKQETMDVNGNSFTMVRGTGLDKREGGKVSFEVAIFSAGGDKVGIVYTDWDTNAPAALTDELKSIIKSIKVTK